LDKHKRVRVRRRGRFLHNGSGREDLRVAVTRSDRRAGYSPIEWRALTLIRAPLSSGQTSALRGGGPSEKQEVTRLRQVIGADLISGAGHSLWLHQTPLEDQCSRTLLCGKQWPRRGHVRETLVSPHAGPLNTSGLCPQTLLVSARLGGGAATGPLVTDHQADERERPSNQSVRLRGYRPDVPVQSVLYR
jgi:hypothetical protein